MITQLCISRFVGFFLSEEINLCVSSLSTTFFAQLL